MAFVDEYTAAIAESAKRTEETLIAKGRVILATSPDFGKYILPHDFDGLADAIKTIGTLKEAHKCIEDMDFLKDCLNHAKRFGEFASQYCVMEARMYLNIASLKPSLDEEDPLTRAQWNIVLWLRGKSEDEVAVLIAQCSDGQRITKLYRDELACARIMSRQGEYRDISDRIINEAKESGRTTLTTSRFYDEFPAKMKPAKADIRAYTERTRDELLRMGAVGLGDGKGTYIVPSQSSREDLIKAVLTRLDSITNDIRNLRLLCDEAGVTFPSSKLRKITAEIGKLKTKEAE